jgi:Xaa-Pro aminopeptidase
MHERAITVHLPTEAELDRYRSTQQLAYRCVEDIAAGLEAGVTEKEVTRRMRAWLEREGVEDWFHLPFAWFGDRTTFRGFRTSLSFFPTGRRLEEGMPFILDVAPVLNGATADIGYSGALGANATIERLLDDLAAHRRLILDRVNAGDTKVAIYQAVDALAASQGYDNRHREYPFRVLAHRVGPLPRHMKNRTVAGFGIRSLRQLARSAAVGARQGRGPLWADGRHDDHPPVPGLWAVEPHLGRGDVGAKFEELLLITPDGARWLDDDLSHVRRTLAATTSGRTA